MTEEGKRLVGIAREAIERHLHGDADATREDGTDADLPPNYRQPAATFVTLTKQGALRGCIGTLEAQRPLVEDLRHNAVAAATHDPRFPALKASELPDVRVEVSVLTPPVPLPIADEEEAVATLHPGVDGVVLSHCAGRATFLPQVWEDLPNPRDFLASLKRKAGLPIDGWGPDYRVATYAVQKWREE